MASLLETPWNDEIGAYGPFFSEQEFQAFKLTADATMNPSNFVIHRCSICKAIVVTVGDRDFKKCAVCGMPA